MHGTVACSLPETTIGRMRRSENGESNDLTVFDVFQIIPHLSETSLPIIFLEGRYGRICSTDTDSPEARSKQMVCPDPGFYQVRDKEVQSGSVNFKGNFVPDERKIVGTQA